MNILNVEKVFVVVPELARKVGLDEAIFLQQLHYELQVKSIERDGHKWMYRTLKGWTEVFSFWGFDKVKRLVMKLEKKGLIVTTDQYNKLKMDRTKWYRINYTEIENLFEEGELLAHVEGALCLDEDAQMDGHEDAVRAGQLLEVERSNLARCEEGKLRRAIQKDLRKNKKNIVDYIDIVREVIHYLNEKTNKQFRVDSKPTQQLIKGRLTDGYSVEDFKRVIDLKVKEWLYNREMNKYLRPDTLFNATKFEGYLNEGNVPAGRTEKAVRHYEPLELDYSAGED